MKSATFLNLIVLGLVLTLPFTGCRKKLSTITPLPGQKVGSVGGDVPPGLPIPGPGTTTGGDIPPSVGIPIGQGHPGWVANPEIFKAQTVYFDFDSAVVKSGEKAKVDVVAAHLKANPIDAVKIEGHCDERGTEEYNRALGEHRALAVREQLIAAGIAPDRVDTISYGEDKPAVVGHDEAAYKKNRRGEFILLTPPR